jgi:hypothetical protein
MRSLLAQLPDASPDSEAYADETAEGSARMRTLDAFRFGPVACLALVTSCARGGGAGPTTTPDAAATPEADASMQPGNLVGGGECSGDVSQDTTVSGTVFDPAGINPLYNVIVYIPTTAVQPLPSGATCDQCGVVASGQPRVTALTGPDGRFVLHHVAAGESVPLVLQLGKWRKQLVIPEVAACRDTPMNDRSVMRLPAKGSEGDMPQMAIATGACDPFECLLLKIGIDPSEFTDDDDGLGHVHVFQGTGGSNLSASTPSAASLWASPSLAAYDLLINACECDEQPDEKPQSSIDNLVAYANGGGRLFNTHYQYYWIDPTKITSQPVVSENPQWQGTAQFMAEQTGVTTITGYVDTSFPKGSALAQWLMVTGGSDVLGEFPIDEARYNVHATNPPSSRWVYNANTGQTGVQGGAVLHYTFNTPVGAPQASQCGRVLYSDFHVEPGDEAPGGATFPQECAAAPMSPQELALEFMFFDLSACIQPDSQSPGPPPTSQ